MRAAAIALVLAFAAPAAGALDSARWPPPADTVDRMSALQERLRDPNATRAQREAAREELARLLKSPAGQARRTPDEKKPARAAIDPFPGVVKPAQVAPRPAPPPEGVARLEVIEPSKPVIDPRTGASIMPTPGGFAVDPRTGAVLHETPYGHVDPRTGRVVPR